MRGKVLYLDQETIVKRAQSQILRPIAYHLEAPNGGRDPTADGPEDYVVPGPPGFSSARYCDCIGLAAWAGGFDRYCPVSVWTAPGVPDHPAFPLYDGYINTDSMIEDATGKRTWFTAYDKPEPGLFIVAESYRKKMPPFRRVIGHIGVMTRVEGELAEEIAVTHCSPSNYAKTDNKSAVAETDASIWFDYYPRHYYVGLSLPRPSAKVA